MKTMLNSRTVLVVGMLVGMTLLAGCGGKQQRMAAHLEKGKALLAQGQIDKARIEIKNVLQIDPRMAEAYYVGGLIEEKQHEWQKAFGNYLRAVEFDPGNQQAQLRLGRLYLFGGDLAKADDSAQKVLKVTPDHPEAQSLAAAVLAKKGDNAAAIGMASKVVDKDPAQVDAVALLAGLRAASGDVHAAEQVLSHGIEASPHSVELRQALIALYAGRNDLEKAEQQYTELVRIDPESLDNRVGLARVQAARGDLPKAEVTLRQAIEAKPDEDNRYLLLADFIGSRKGVAEAEQYLIEGIKSRPKAYVLQFSLAALYRNTGNADQAEQVDRRIIEADRIGPDGIRARTELAESRLRRGHSDEAATLIAEVLKDNPRDNQALMLRGQLALDRGDALSAVADFRSVYKDQPNSVAVMTQLARAHLGNGEPELAKEMLGKAVALYPKLPEVRITLAELKATTGDATGALEDLGGVLKLDSKNYRALNAKTDMQISQRNWKGAEQTLGQLKADFPDDARVHQRIGNFYLAQKRFDQAISAYEAALSRVPGAIEPLTGLSNAYVAQQRPQRAIERIEKSIEAVPGNYMAYALMGHIEAGRKQYGEAEAAFRKAVEINSQVSGTHGELANYLLVRGNADAAEKALQDGLRNLPQDTGLLLQLAELYRVVGKADQSIVTYEDILKREPGNDLVANNLASMLLDLRTDRTSHERALALVRHFEGSRNPAYRDSLGWAYFRLGEYAQALPQLRNAVERAPQAAVVQYHLGMALYRSGDVASAKPYLRKAVDGKAQFPGVDEARKILAES